MKDHFTHGCSCCFAQYFIMNLMNLFEQIFARLHRLVILFFQAILLLFLFLLLGQMMNFHSFFTRKNYVQITPINHNDQKQSKMHTLLLVVGEELKKYSNFLVSYRYQIKQASTFNSFHKQMNVNRKAFFSKLFYRISCHHSLLLVHHYFQNYLYHHLFRNFYIYLLFMTDHDSKNSINHQI